MRLSLRATPIYRPCDPSIQPQAMQEPYPLGERNSKRAYPSPFTAALRRRLGGSVGEYRRRFGSCQLSGSDPP